jgi:hypothetical protein
MAEATLCGVCKKNEVAFNCNECGIPVCDICKKEVTLEEQTPGTKVKGDVTMSSLRPASRKIKVCPKCMAEADFF